MVSNAECRKKSEINTICGLNGAVYWISFALCPSQGICFIFYSFGAFQEMPVSLGIAISKMNPSKTIRNNCDMKKGGPDTLMAECRQQFKRVCSFHFFFSFLSCTERRKNLSHLAKVVISFTVPGYLASPRTFIGCVCALMQHMDSAFG